MDELSDSPGEQEKPGDLVVVGPGPEPEQPEPAVDPSSPELRTTQAIEAPFSELLSGGGGGERAPRRQASDEPEPEPKYEHDFKARVPEGVPGTCGVPLDADDFRRIESSRELARQLIQCAENLCEIEKRRTGSTDSSVSIRTIAEDMRGVAATREKELKVKVISAPSPSPYAVYTVTCSCMPLSAGRCWCLAWGRVARVR
jgi:hypothetical protein